MNDRRPGRSTRRPVEYFYVPPLERFLKNPLLTSWLRGGLARYVNKTSGLPLYRRNPYSTLSLSGWEAFARDHRSVHRLNRSRCLVVEHVETRRLARSRRKEGTSSLGVTYLYPSFSNARRGHPFPELSIVFRDERLSEATGCAAER